MPFAYYERLSARDRAIYRRSDSVTLAPLLTSVASSAPIHLGRSPAPRVAASDAHDAATMAAQIAVRLT